MYLASQIYYLHKQHRNSWQDSESSVYIIFQLLHLVSLASRHPILFCFTHSQEFYYFTLLLLLFFWSASASWFSCVRDPFRFWKGRSKSRKPLLKRSHFLTFDAHFRPKVSLFSTSVSSYWASRKASVGGGGARGRGKSWRTQTRIPSFSSSFTNVF